MNYCNRWRKSRFAIIFEENKILNFNLQSTRALQFQFGEVVDKKKYDLTDDLKDTYKKYCVVQPNDIMLNGLNLNYDFVTQRVGQVKFPGIITSAYMSLRCRVGYNSRFY